MKNKLPLLFLLIFVVLIIFGILAGASWKISMLPVCRQNCQDVVFVVNYGEGASAIADRLVEEKLIRNSFIFKLYVYYSNLRNKIQAGEFTLNPNMSTSEIAQELTHGTLDSRVTIIEGWRREQIAEKLSQSDLTNFNTKDFLEKTKNSEGQIFPDTYLIPKNADTTKIIDIFSKNFNKKVGIVSKETLILASIVEREVPHEEDRPVIAGILLKRLNNNWPLQIDATVQFAIASKKCEAGSGKCDWWPKNLTKADLSIKSSYNTYLNQGLPPTPICNPGLKAIKAVENPTKSDYWYYLSDKSGITHFAKTIEEHNQNIKKYLKNE